jgi:endonuclease YncB( thermonuclease family)
VKDQDPRGLVADRPNRYAGTVHHHHDGDTIYCSMWDTLIQLYLIVGVRIRGTQAPELTQRGGPDVAAAVAHEWPPGTAAVAADAGPYSRPGHIVASLTLAGVDVATWLLDRGYAVPDTGAGPRPVVSWPPIPRVKP